MTEIVPTDAAALLRLIAGDGNTVFRTFDQIEGRKGTALSRGAIVGPIDAHGIQLASLNEKGAAVCFVVNEAAGKAKKDADVTRIRAVFIDLDGSPIEPVLSCSLRPHAVVESSPGRFHAYWVVRNFPLERFTPVQRSLAARFGGDQKVKNLSRVMRLPGYWHEKQLGSRFRSRLTSLETLEKIGAYSVEQILAELTPDVAPTPKASKRTFGGMIPEGVRNDTLFERASGFFRDGLTWDEVNRRLQKINAEQCAVPLCATEVDAIVTSAQERSGGGFTAVPNAVWDSHAFQTLAAHGQRVVLQSYRRFNGHNNGKISCAVSDFEMAPDTFYKHRAAAYASGLIYPTRIGSDHIGVDGRKACDLIAIRYTWAEGQLVTCSLKPAVPKNLERSPYLKTGYLDRYTGTRKKRLKKGAGREADHFGDEGNEPVWDESPGAPDGLRRLTDDGSDEPQSEAA